jgi:hypothetical protein
MLCPIPKKLCMVISMDMPNKIKMHSSKDDLVSWVSLLSRENFLLGGGIFTGKGGYLLLGGGGRISAKGA